MDENPLAFLRVANVPAHTRLSIGFRIMFLYVTIWFAHEALQHFLGFPIWQWNKFMLDVADDWPAVFKLIFLVLWWVSLIATFAAISIAISYPAQFYFRALPRFYDEDEVAAADKAVAAELDGLRKEIEKLKRERNSLQLKLDHGEGDGPSSFHRLWGLAGCSSRYDKEIWNKAQVQLNEVFWPEQYPRRAKGEVDD